MHLLRGSSATAMKQRGSPTWLVGFGLLFALRVTASSAPDICAIEPGAIVSDACASYSTLDDLNEALSPSLKAITQSTDFFAYYRLNLYNRVCPFWSDASGMCGNIACAVITLDNEEDIPDVWRAEELSKLEGPKAGHPGRQAQRERVEKPLQGQLGEDVGESCVVEYDDECDERDYCLPEDESASAKGDYVSLVENPERFTGYSGPSARQVWDSIYRENCFSKAPPAGSRGPLDTVQPHGEASSALKSVIQQRGRQMALARSSQPGPVDELLEFDEECLEKRVFYRVISGMHASISAHLCWDYLNQTTGTWGPNVECYQERLDRHPERISNLYFNYALVLRAVIKLGHHLQDYTFCSGDVIQDRLTKQKVLAFTKQASAWPKIFDETSMFRDEAALGLKEDFKHRFRNVSRLMDCVGCDKCRLWGKLQTAGYGTALKVLFEYEEDTKTPSSLTLRRTELVALVNTLDRISTSLSAVSTFRKMLKDQHTGDADGESVSAEHSGGGGLVDDGDFDDIDIDMDEDDEEEDPQDRPRETFSEVFAEEFDKVWRAAKFVLRGWWEFPGKAWDIILDELLRVWDYWLGLPTMPRSWEIRFPTADEL